MPPGGRHDQPWAYFITFACYGGRLHGDERGSVDRHHNSFGGRFLEPDSRRVRVETKLMRDTGAALDGEARELVLRTMREVCRHQQWTLYAAHVRRSHVHVVVRAEVAPEEVMRKLKAYGSRALNRRFGFREKRWVRHGSTRRLWSPAEVDVTVDYVVRRQGEPMAVYEDCERWSEVLR